MYYIYERGENMRKLIFILSMIVVLLVLFLDTTYVAANTLSTSYIKKLFIVQGSTNVLDYPGYSLIETNVNYNKEGQYFAKYR